MSGRAASGAKAFNLRFIFVKESEDRIESRAAIVNSIRRSFLFDVIPPLVSDYTPSRNITSRPIICLSILAAFRKIDRSLLDPRLCVNLIYAKSLDIIKPMEHHFSFLPFSFFPLLENLQRTGGTRSRHNSTAGLSNIGTTLYRYSSTGEAIPN